MHLSDPRLRRHFDKWLEGPESCPEEGFLPCECPETVCRCWAVWEGSGGGLTRQHERIPTMAMAELRLSYVGALWIPHEFGSCGVGEWRVAPRRLGGFQLHPLVACAPTLPTQNHAKKAPGGSCCILLCSRLSHHPPVYYSTANTVTWHSPHPRTFKPSVIMLPQHPLKHTIHNPGPRKPLDTIQLSRGLRVVVHQMVIVSMRPQQ